MGNASSSRPDMQRNLHEAPKITRAALGSTASLGDLYDARRDDFCGISLFKSAIPEAAVTIYDANFSDIRLAHSDNFSEKAAKLEVSAELQASVLARLLPLKGSAQYLTDQKKSAKMVKSSLVYNIKTKDESLNIYHNSLRGTFALDALEGGVSTHVVVGISWGANSILSCFYENKEGREDREITGSLSAELKKAATTLGGKGNVEVSEDNKLNGIQFEIHVFGDILSENQLPTTFETALEFMSQVPTLVKSCNNGKGKPLTYHLLPISHLQSYIGFSLGADVLVKSLEETSLARVIQMFEEISTAQQKLNDFFQDAREYSYCVNASNFAAIASLRKDVTFQEACARTELSRLLTEIRSGKRGMEQLDNFLQNFQLGSGLLEGVTKKLVEWREMTDKIRFAQALTQQGAKYIGYGMTLEEEILQNVDATFYVLYFTQNAKTEESARWNENRQMFFREMKKQTEGHKYFAVDCDIHPTLHIGESLSHVQVMKGGTILEADLLAERSQALETPLVQLVSGSTVRVLTPPNKRVPLVIRCAGKTCHPQKVHEWTCQICRDVLEYGFDDHVYCVCGKTPAISLEFKCPDPKHGVTYERHDAEFLVQLLSMLRPFPERNILILGETGVGKSTWINAFINYMTYESLEEAEAEELVTLIPSKFSVSNDDYEDFFVSTGSDGNEDQQVGRSATQMSKVYTFPVGKTTIRLIDTPGIGDTRGVEQDKTNFQNILFTLTHFEELHGICILLKPQNARLGVMFRFCIQELLTYLHRGASQNIVFCFTNSRGTFYRPGETLPALKMLLKENEDVEIPIGHHTVYCYDSEPYRYLAATKRKPPVNFSDSERANFAASWQKSADETKRMLDHFTQIPPHDTKNTLNLNYARTIVVNLPGPLAEISRNIQKNKKTMEAEKVDIEAAAEDLEVLKEKRIVQRTDMNIQMLTNIKKGLSIAAIAGGITACVLSPVFVPLLPLALVSGAASTIGPSVIANNAIVQVAMAEVVRRTPDASVEMLFTQNLSAREIKEKMIEAKVKEIEECEVELKTIEEASVKFAHFLKANSITAHNDAMEQYFNHMITEEENKVSTVETKALLDTLKKSKDSYLREREVLEEQINKNSGDANMQPPGPNDIHRLIKELKGMKHSGKVLRQVLECVTNTHNASYTETVVRPPKKINNLRRAISKNDE